VSTSCGGAHPSFSSKVEVDNDMKVIRKGRKQRGWAKEYTCTGAGNGNGGCGAVLLVEEGDLYHTYHHSYDGSSDTFTTFRCCQCSVQTDLTVPSGVNVASSERAMKAARSSVSPVD
jgi:hypothetical protein